MPNLNLQNESHGLTNVSMLVHVSMVYYCIEFSPQLLQLFVRSMFLEGVIDYCNIGK